MHDNIIKNVMELLLGGEGEVFESLRSQYYGANILSQTCNSAGFFVEFEVGNLKLDTSKYRDNFQISNVYGRVNGIDGAVGFIVFVKNGAIDFLEGYTVLDKWPENDDEIELYYVYNSEKYER